MISDNIDVAQSPSGTDYYPKNKREFFKLSFILHKLLINLFSHKKY